MHLLELTIKNWHFFFVQQHKTIDDLLARGEKLDSLVEKSSDLNVSSKVYKIPTLVYFTY